MTDSCTVCGDTNTRQTDGQLYCRTCDTHIENFNEYEQEDETTVMFHASIKKKKKTAPTREIDKAEEELLRSTHTTEHGEPKKQKTDIMCEMFGETELNDQNRKKVDYDTVERFGHLRNLSHRVIAFTDQLIKAAKILSTELGFPKNYPKQCFAVFQRYLQCCGAAFVDYEFTEDIDNMVRVLSVGSKSAFRNNMLREKDIIKAKRKSEGIKKLEQSCDIWKTLADKTLTEDLALQADNNEDFEDATSMPKKLTDVTQYEEINTKLSLECARAARAIYLEADALVAILHISAANLGIQFSMLSDIVRWFREDRIRIPRINTNNKRRFANPKETESVFLATRVGRERFDIPLFEYQRCTLWIWQSLNLPSLITTIDFQQLTARTVYHLNLPSGIMQRISVLMQLAPPNDSLDSGALRIQGDIDQGISCHDYCNLRFAKRTLGFQRLRFSFGRSDSKSEYSDVFFSTETKVMAYILMTLKLTYGLDDSSVNLESTGNLENMFNISDWLLQLKMRLMLCEGYDPFDVLQSERPIFDILPTVPLCNGHGMSIHNTGNNPEGRPMTHQRIAYRGRGFINCIPNMSIIESSANVPNALADFVSRRSFNKNCDNALYAPLRHQPEIVLEFFEKNKVIGSEHYKDIDISRLKMLNRQYDNYELHPKESDRGSYDYLASVCSVERCETAKERRDWQRFFPCAKTYTRYPRPLWAQGNVGAISENNDYLARLKKRSTAAGFDMIGSGPHCFFASNRCVNDLFIAAEKSMSNEFRELLQTCSKVIGEDVALLYTAFIMLEYQIVERSEFHELTQKLIDGVATPVNILRFDADGECKNHTVQMTTDEDISDRKELRIVRFGVPKSWGTSFWRFDEALNDKDAEWMDSDSDIERTTGSDRSSESDDDINETAETSMVNETSPTFDKPRFSARGPRFSENVAYDFDTIWQMVTMRYW